MANVKKEAEARSLARMDSAVLNGNPVVVSWIKEGNELGYTQMAGKGPVNIHLGYSHPLVKAVPKAKQPLMRMGVNTHELMHQCMTAFDYTEQIMKGAQKVKPLAKKEKAILGPEYTRKFEELVIPRALSEDEQAILMVFLNTLEDPAIEYFAGNFVGGTPLAALKYSIRVIYKGSPSIDDAPNAFKQLTAALINFGDMGIIKGHFTYPEAEEAFRLIAPLYNIGIRTVDAKRRLDIGYLCFLLTRSIWEEELKDREEMRKLVEELRKELAKKDSPLRKAFEKMLKERAEAGDGSDGEDGDEDSESSADKRRQIILKKIEDDKASKSSSGSKSAGDTESDESSEGDSESEGIYAEDDESEEDGSAGAGEGSSEGESSSESEGSSSKGSSDESEASSGKSSSKITEGGHGGGTRSELGTDSEDADAELEDEEDEAEEAAAEDASESISREEKKMEEEEKGAKDEAGVEDIEVDFEGDYGDAPGFSREKINPCNEPAPDGNEEFYARLVAEYQGEIKSLRKSLDKIFKADIEELAHTTSGKYNIIRGSVGCTAKMFDKRREPGKAKDAAVVLAVDLSGSMCSGTRIQDARKASIIFAEALTELNIPYTIFGFTADAMRGGKRSYAIHQIFVDFRNRRKDRVRLSGMSAGGNNFDGYAIRYASSILKTRKEEHKMLFVLSDGLPECTAYNRINGLADTTLAIRDARKQGQTVFGLAFGRGAGSPALAKMYGNDFCYIPDSTQLTASLCRKLEKVFKRAL